MSKYKIGDTVYFVDIKCKIIDIFSNEKDELIYKSKTQNGTTVLLEEDDINETIEMNFPKDFNAKNGRGIISVSKIQSFVNDILSNNNETEAIFYKDTVIGKIGEKIIIADGYWVADID